MAAIKKYRTPVATLRSSIKSALAATCPRCGEGRIFAGLLATKTTCDACGLDLTTLAAEDGPAFFAIGGVAAVVIPMALAGEFLLAPPYWMHLAVWPPAVVVGTILILRPLKAFLMAQQYTNLVRQDDGAG